MRLAFFSILLLLGLYSIKIHQMVRGGYFTREEYNSKGYLCELSTTESLSASKRLDLLLAVHILDPSDEDCLGAESDLALWNQDEFDKPMGYFVKYYLETDKEKKTEYQKVLCEKYPLNEACQLSKWMLTESSALEANKSFSLNTSRVLLLVKSLKKQNFTTAASLMADLLKDKNLEPYLQKNYVRMAWQIQNLNLSTKRSPASSELKSTLKDFKKRFDIP